MTWNIFPACHLGIHPRDGILREFLTKSEVCAEQERVSWGATRWFGSERSATIETEEFASGGGVGNKVSSPSWVWRDIVQLGMCVGVDACKFK